VKNELERLRKESVANSSLSVVSFVILIKSVSLEELPKTCVLYLFNIFTVFGLIILFWILEVEPWCRPENANRSSSSNQYSH
jgi:hypothetical protein